MYNYYLLNNNVKIMKEMKPNAQMKKFMPIIKDCTDN